MFTASWKVRAGMASGLLVLLVCAPDAPSQGPPPGGSAGGNVTTPGPSTNNPPIIVSLTAKQVPGRKFRITGVVSDETPAACGVGISGVASGNYMCDSSGNFEGLLAAPALGPCTAVAGDGQLVSAPFPFVLTNSPPSVSVVASQLPNNAWKFSGGVSDEAPAGLIVVLSGVPGLNGASAVVLADGSWSVTVTLAPGASGTVTASTTDWYGASGSGSTYFGS